MNRAETLDEIRRLLEREPSVQRKWVWERRERILEYLIARYGPFMTGPDAQRSDMLAPPSSPPPRKTEPPILRLQVRPVLEDIARLNDQNRESGHRHFPRAMKN